MRGGFGEVGRAGILQWRGKASPPCHIPLKSKCRGTSPGRSGSVAQRLGRQAVTALGRSPARLAWPLPTPAHPVWPRLTGVRQPTPSGQAGALHYCVPSQSLYTGFESAAASTRERGPAEMLGVLLMHPGPWMRAQRSLLLMITPASPPHHQAILPSGPAQVHTSPWQQWQGRPHNVSGQQAKCCQIGMRERHFGIMLKP